MTTTGYGDEVPSTILGMCFAIMAMCFGILLIALPVAIVGSKFQEAFAEMEADQGRKRQAALAERISKEARVEDRNSGDASTPPSPTSRESGPAVAGYAELTAVQREIATAQRGYVQSQQDVGKTMG